MPTNQPMIRIDNHDVVYKTEDEKFDAVIEEIQDCHERGQPVLVGTVSIEKSERVAEKLKKTGVKHYVLNAKNHEREAEIVAQAGRFGAVTISTNMAGRGTDIVLGGNPEFMAAAEAGTRDPNDREFPGGAREVREQCAAEREQVLAAGGLHILGTERHESRRIDNQLRGRSGRQGDPGSSRFFLSLEDDLLRIFGADRLKGLMGRIGMEDGVPIEHRWISQGDRKRAEESRGAQLRHPQASARIRRRDEQAARGGLPSPPRAALAARRSRTTSLDMCDELIEEIVDGARETDEATRRNGTGRRSRTRSSSSSIFVPISRESELERQRHRSARRPDRGRAASACSALYDQREAEFTEPVMRQIEKIVMLQTLDSLWKDHLLAMDHLKEGIGLRGYAQLNPLVEYQKEGFTMFEALMARDADRTWSRKSFRCRCARAGRRADSSSSQRRSGS